MNSITVATIIWIMTCVNFVLYHGIITPEFAVGSAVSGVLLWCGIMLGLCMLIEWRKIWKKARS